MTGTAPTPPPPNTYHVHGANLKRERNIRNLYIAAPICVAVVVFILALVVVL